MAQGVSGAAGMPDGGDAAPGYLAAPPLDSGPFPGVVVVHDAYGMTPDLRRQADRLAVGGYLALAPDLWHGKNWVRCMQAAMRQVMAGSGPMFEQIEAAASWLKGQPSCTGKVGVVGFCMGGGFALMCAPRGAFSAASVNYGPVPREIGRRLDGACPVVASYGGKDRMARSMLPRLEQALAGQETPHDVKVYPNATHAFMNDHEGRYGTLTRVIGMRYDPDAASDAWRRIFAFFAQHLA